MKNVYAVLISLISFGGISQVEFNHSVGLNYLMVHYSAPSTTSFIGYPGACYNPRVDFTFGKELSLSITAYPTAAIDVQFNSRTGGSGFFAGELPILAQLNFGHHSTTSSRSGFGGFIGAGYSLGYYSSIGALHGLTTNAGVKFEAFDKSFGIRLFYTKPFNLEEDEKSNVFGIGLFYNFLR